MVNLKFSSKSLRNKKAKIRTQQRISKLYRHKAQATRSRNSQLENLENDVSEVTSLLRDNVEKVLERGENIDRLQSRSEDLECSSSHFRNTAVKIRKKMWWNNCKMTCIIATVISLIIVVIIIVILVETKPWESSSGGKHNGSKVLLHPTITRSSPMMLTLTTPK